LQGPAGGKRRGRVEAEVRSRPAFTAALDEIRSSPRRCVRGRPPRAPSFQRSSATKRHDDYRFLKSGGLTWLPGGFRLRSARQRLRRFGRWRCVLRPLPYRAVRSWSARNSAWSCMRVLTSSWRSASSLASSSASGSPAASSLFKNPINLSMRAREPGKALVAEVSAGSLIPAVCRSARPSRVPARFSRGTLSRSLAMTRAG
jgi:hypothetical protein